MEASSDLSWKDTRLVSKTETYIRGDRAVAEANLDLTKKGYHILYPTNLSLPFDLVAYKDKTFIRIQVKHKKLNEDKRSYSIPTRTNSYIYKDGDFDYFALFLAELNIVVYPPISFKGLHIRSEAPINNKPFYWCEDFLQITDTHKKRTAKELGLSLSPPTDLMIEGHKKTSIALAGRDRPITRKVERPSKDILEKELWETPTSVLSKKYGVTDVAIAKWAKAYGIKKPGRGYWEKLRHADTIKSK